LASTPPNGKKKGEREGEGRHAKIVRLQKPARKMEKKNKAGVESLAPKEVAPEAKKKVQTKKRGTLRDRKGILGGKVKAKVKRQTGPLRGP